MAIDLGQKVIDSAIHITVPSVYALFPYLTEHWREYVNESAFRGPAFTPFPDGAPTTARPENKPEEGPAGSSLELVRQQGLDAWNVAVGILNCGDAVDSPHN